MKKGMLIAIPILLFCSCNKEYECQCEGNAVGVNGTWKENDIGYETAQQGCEVYEACTWVEISN